MTVDHQGSRKNDTPSKPATGPHHNPPHAHVRGTPAERQPVGTGQDHAGLGRHARHK